MSDRYPDLEVDSDRSQGVFFGGPPETGKIDLVDTVILGGMTVRVPMVSFQSLSPWPRKSVFGDTTNSSDDYFTTIVYSNLSGGEGVEDMNETTDVNRLWYGTLMTRRPNAICKPYLSRKYADIPGAPISPRYFVGSIWSTALTKYLDVFVYGGNVVWGDPPSTALSSAGAATGVPSDKGILFRGTGTSTFLVWPTGAGYTRISEAGTVSNVASSATVPAAISMVVWNQLLIALDIDGQLWYNPDLGSGNWNKYIGAYLPYNQIGRRLLAGYDRGGEKCLYVVTNHTVWQFVAEGIALVEVQGFTYPPTQHSGKGSCIWNEDMYVSSGMTVMRYSGGSKQYVGLDRDDGLPQEYYGYITDLLPMDQGMLAFVTWEGIENTTYKYHSIHEFSGVGWQMLWRSDGLYTGPNTPRSMGISFSGTTPRSRLYWGGWDVESPGYNCMMYLDFPVTPVSPRQVPTWENFQPGTFFAVSSWFDAQLEGYVKLGNAVEFKLNRMKEMSKFRVYAQIDDEDSPWIFLGETSRNGVTSFSLGDSDGQESEGETFIKIRFRFELEDHNYRTPYIEYIAFSCVSIPYPMYSFSFGIDYSRAVEGMTPDDIHLALDELYTNGKMTTFMWKNKLYRGKVTQYQGSGAPGKSSLSSGSVSVLALPESIAKQWFSRSIR